MTGAYSSLATRTDAGISHASMSFYRRLANNFPIGGSDLRPYQNPNTSTFLHFGHQFTDGWADGIGFGFLYSDKEGGIGEYWGSETTILNKVRWTTYLPYVKYQKELAEDLNLNSYASITQSSEYGRWTGNPYNTFTKDSTGQVIGHDGGSIGEWKDIVRSVDIAADLTYNLTDTRSLIMGVNYYQNQGMSNEDGTLSWNLSKSSDTNYTYWVFGEDSKFMELKETSRTYSGFVQYADRLPVLDGLLVTAGFREDYGTYMDESFQQFSPRFALVQKLNESMNVKLLYGTALRAPGQKEFNLNDESNRRIAQEGDADKFKIGNLSAETIQSIEGGITYTYNKVMASVSGFYNITENTLELYHPATYGTENLNGFRNSSESIEATGVEADIQVLLPHGFRLLVNYAGATSWNSEGEPVINVPNNKLNAGLLFAMDGDFPIKASIINKTVFNYYASKDSLADGNNILDAYISVGLTENFDINFQVKNALDEYALVASGGGTDLVPLDRREFIIGLGATF